MRGEYNASIVTESNRLELPPRARRILTHTTHAHTHAGTTSACAENTFIELAIAGYIRNYLRVRGEYTTMGFERLGTQELPPRARRILTTPDSKLGGYGTTSACAENTGWYPRKNPQTRNYLRVRGEYLRLRSTFYRIRELPPRARRIPQIPQSCKPNERNYLRVRGEYFGLSPVAPMTTELPPRARRIRWVVKLW